MLDLAPVGEGSSPADALRASLDLVRGGRAPRLPPLLGGRAPQHAGHRQLVAGGAAGLPRRRHEPDPPRVGRGDAAQPRAARDRRAVRDARGAAPGPDRPRHRARARHRPAHRLRPAAGRGAARAGPAQPARRAPRLLQRDVPRRPPVPAASPRCPRSATSPRSGCSGRATTAPAWPALLGPPVLVRPPLRGRQHRRRAGRSTATRSGRRRCSTSRTCCSAPRSSAPTPRSGPAGCRSRATCRSCACGPGRPGRFPTPEEAAAFHPTPAEKESIKAWSSSRIVGDPGGGGAISSPRWWSARAPTR